MIKLKMPLDCNVWYLFRALLSICQPLKAIINGLPYKHLRKFPFSFRLIPLPNNYKRFLHSTTPRPKDPAYPSPKTPIPSPTIN